MSILISFILHNHSRWVYLPWLIPVSPPVVNVSSIKKFLIRDEKVAKTAKSLGQTYEMNEANVLYLIISGYLERVIVKNDIRPQGKKQKYYLLLKMFMRY